MMPAGSPGLWSAQWTRPSTISRNWSAATMAERYPALADFPVVIQLPVAWGEMDSYHHVNNVVYFRYFENARLEYFRRLDWFNLERAVGVGPILAATQCRFRKPLTYPDTISVTARVPQVAEDRFTIEHLVVSHRPGA